VRRRADKKYPGNSKNDNKFDASPPKSRTDEEYVTDQLNNFRERYGNLPGYSFAEAYLESILSLATSGKESPRVQEVGKRFYIFLLLRASILWIFLCSLFVIGCLAAFGACHRLHSFLKIAYFFV